MRELVENCNPLLDLCGLHSLGLYLNENLSIWQLILIASSFLVLLWLLENIMQNKNPSGWLEHSEMKRKAENKNKKAYQEKHVWELTMKYLRRYCSHLIFPKTDFTLTPNGFLIDVVSSSHDNYFDNFLIEYLIMDLQIFWSRTVEIKLWSKKTKQILFRRARVLSLEIRVIPHDS